MLLLSADALLHDHVFLELYYSCTAVEYSCLSWYSYGSCNNTRYKMGVSSIGGAIETMPDAAAQGGDAPVSCAKFAVAYYPHIA